jgi:hypothetical protein
MHLVEHGDNFTLTNLTLHLLHYQDNSYHMNGFAKPGTIEELIPYLR